MFTPDQLKNQYALVTGASEGLGREFALQLATIEMIPVLVGRTESKLKEAAQDIQQKTGKECFTITADLSRQADLEKAIASLRDKSIQIRVLVNNAGSGYWGHFENADVDMLTGMVDLTVKAPIFLAHALFEDLRSFKNSAVINVCSVAALQPVPYMSVYAATKSFMADFSMALWKEWAPYGIYVQTLMPGAIDTKFDEKSGGFQAPFRKDTASTIVSLSLNALMTDQKPLVFAKGSLMQKIFARVLPTAFLVREVAKVFSPKARN